MVLWPADAAELTTSKQQSLKDCKFARLKPHHCNDKVMQIFSLLGHYVLYIHYNQNLY